MKKSTHWSNRTSSPNLAERYKRLEASVDEEGAREFNISMSKTLAHILTGCAEVEELLSPSLPRRPRRAVSWLESVFIRLMATLKASRNSSNSRLTRSIRPNSLKVAIVKPSFRVACRRRNVLAPLTAAEQTARALLSLSVNVYLAFFSIAGTNLETKKM